jgi:dTDP-4-amino-4,6-dideoxygalactose transaminase
MEKILRTAKDHGLFVVEDASHAHGAEYNGKKVGAFGNANCFSLYATKIITSAEGGLITTDDESTASRIRILKRLGEVGRFEHKEIGYSYRMSDVHAAIGLAQLEKVDVFLKKRKQNAANLTKLLTEFNEYVDLPAVKGNVKHAFYYYAILLRKNLLEKVNRDTFGKILKAENIVPTSYYPKPLHLQEAYKFLNYKKSDFPVAEDVCNRAITLPIHPALNTKDMFDIYTAIDKIIQHFEG